MNHGPGAGSIVRPVDQQSRKKERKREKKKERKRERKKERAYAVREAQVVPGPV